MSKPLKRHPAITELSRDHHHGLLLCWKIKQGFKKGVDTKRMANYAVSFYQNHLNRHFKEEEEIIFPLLSGHAMVAEALAQHKSLRKWFSNLEDGKGQKSSLQAIAHELELHVRFEERELFPELQRLVDEDKLIKAGELLMKKAEKQNPNAWHDQFWMRAN